MNIIDDGVELARESGELWLCDDAFKVTLMGFGDMNPGLGSNLGVLLEYDPFVVVRSPNRFLFPSYFCDDDELVLSDHLLIYFQANP